MGIAGTWLIFWGLAIVAMVLSWFGARLLALLPEIEELKSVRVPLLVFLSGLTIAGGIVVAIIWMRASTPKSTPGGGDMYFFWFCVVQLIVGMFFWVPVLAFRLYLQWLDVRQYTLRDVLLSVMVIAAQLAVGIAVYAHFKVPPNPYALGYEYGAEVIQIHGGALEVRITGSTDLKAFARLGGLAGVKVISISDRTVSNDELAKIFAVPDLRLLAFRASAISDNALAGLKGCSNLEKLVLQDTPVSDVALCHLAAIPNLNEVFLQGAFTDQSLLNLLGCPKLRRLEVHGKKVTEEGIDEFEKRTGYRIIVVSDWTDGYGIPKDPKKRSEMEKRRAGK